MEMFTDDYFMQQALREANKGKEKDEVPVGAVIVSNDRIIARAHNQTEILNDTTAHAEMIAITAASTFLGSKYLNECTHYVTLEPCVMCAGALRWAQVGRVVYGAEDAKSGFMRYGKEVLHPKTKLEFGIMADQCQNLLQEFFRNRREAG